MNLKKNRNKKDKLRNKKTKIDVDSTLISLVIEIDKLKTKTMDLMSIVKKLDIKINGYE